MTRIEPGSILLIRHAEREDIPPGTDGWGIPLTDKGRADARSFGRNLSSVPGVIPFTAVSSPAGRCVETASLVLASAGIPGEPRPSAFLASAYLADAETAYPAVNRMGYDRAIWEYIDAGSFPGLHPLREASEKLMERMRGYAGGGTLVCVSHDVVILPFLAHYCPAGARSLEGKWIGFLMGAIVAPNGEVSPFDPGE